MHLPARKDYLIQSGEIIRELLVTMLPLNPKAGYGERRLA